MTQRKQCTIANGVVSSHLEIVCGVPQGSILGPLFFIVYVNDINFVLEKCHHQLYADDTVLYLTGNVLLICKMTCLTLKAGVIEIN